MNSAIERLSRIDVLVEPLGLQLPYGRGLGYLELVDQQFFSPVQVFASLHLSVLLHGQLVNEPFGGGALQALTESLAHHDVDSCYFESSWTKTRFLESGSSRWLLLMKLNEERLRVI